VQADTRFPTKWNQAVWPLPGKSGGDVKRLVVADERHSPAPVESPHPVFSGHWRNALSRSAGVVRKNDAGGHSLPEFDDHRALVSILDGQLPVTLTLVDLIHPRNHRDQ
jgi:hypothetical protein